MKLPCLWVLGCALALWTAFAPREAAAQTDPMAPMGAHHAGHGPNLGGGGGYSAAVPLDLPEARGGLPVPVSLVATGIPMGAAGRGWDVPLSFIREDKTFAHRRPSGPLGGTPHMRPRVTLTLFGRTTELVQRGDDWVPRSSPGGLVARRYTITNWKVHDGNGLTYVFNLQPASDLRLLSRIEGSRQAVMIFDYDFRFPTVHPQSGTHALPPYSGSAIDLVRVQYNFAEQGPAKHEVLLEYGADNPMPLSINVLAGDNLRLLRLRTLESIVVRSRPQKDASLQTLARYRLHYETDPDTRLPRLQSVTLSGQEGTPEANQELPVARYEYGTATTPITLSDGAAGTELRYAPLVQPVAFAPQAKHTQIAGSLLVSGDRLVVEQQLMDVTGDGRADLVFKRNHPTHPLMVARQRPGGGGFPVLTDPSQTGTFNDGVMTKSALDAFSHGQRFDPFPDDFLDEKTDTITDTWSQFVDANGDGRPDLIDARELTNNRWVVYLNTPADGFPQNTRWVRRVYDVSFLATLLTARGNRLSGGRVPLMRQYTGTTIAVDICWRYDFDDDVWRKTSDVPCPLGQPPHMDRTGETTATAWRLLDFNGDGGLDFLMEPQGPRTVIREPQPCPTGGTPQPGRPECSIPSENLIEITQRSYSVEDSNTLEVMFNHGPITRIIPQARVVTVGGCGLGRTRVSGLSPTSIPNPREECALEDVNGDGLVDSISQIPAGQLSTALVAHLGTGRAFSSAYLPLPGPTAYSTYRRTGACTEAQDTTTTQGYRDLTGDGLPDFIGPVRDGVGASGQPRFVRGVQIGTGAGFAPGIKITGGSGPFDLSRVSDKCNPTASLTVAGVYELDGDGRPEQVVLNARGELEVHQLVGRSGSAGVLRALSAGSLTAIENGHGARVEITYRSAKDDGRTPHQVPYSEIVVGEVKTIEQKTGKVALTKYAHGRALLGYDPIEGRFQFPGYGRSVGLSSSNTATTPEGGVATVTDTHPDLIPLGATNPLPLNLKQQFERYLKTGSPQVVTTLVHPGLFDPSALLTINIHTDSRVVSQTSHVYDSKHFGDDPGVPSDPACRYIANPYEMTNVSSLNTCTTHGFLFESSSDSWYGSSSPWSGSPLANVRTHDKVLAVDDFGRVTRWMAGNDMRRSDDDLCLETAYAAPPPNTFPRVLSAPATVRAGVCTKALTLSPVLSVEQYEYDKLPIGQVSEGFPTARQTQRHDSQTGAWIATTRDFEAEYDGLGNLSKQTMPDGARSNTMTLTYDPFGLAITSETVIGKLGADATTLETKVEIDPVSLQPIGITEPNGTRTGATYDGFGRPVLETVTPLGAAAGALSHISYLGFEGGSPQGRRVTVKRFDQLVPLANASALPGRTTTTLLDELGRTVKTTADLGSDYGQDLILQDVAFDAFGRIAFAADPYPSDEAAAKPYGTTYFYNLDGTVRCAVRGRGRQPFTNETNEALEVYPTCYSHRFEAGTSILATKSADALLLGSPQASVERTVTLSAIGSLLSRSTIGPSGRLEHAEFAYDRLGNTIAATRFASPQFPVPADPVSWTFRYDSLGQMTRMSEPNTATRTFNYTNWSELKSIEVTKPDGTVERQSMAFDGLGRMTWSGEFLDGSPVPGTEYRYFYDKGTSIHPAQPAKNVLGRLARAQSQTSDVFLGYDLFGRLSNQARRDPQGAIYVETGAFDADGTLTEIGLVPPDTGQVERVKYEYDSARRLRAAEHRDAADHGTRLYTVDEIDAFGRVRQASLGPANSAVYFAKYADTGRRLLHRTAVESPNGDNRSIEYLGFDPVGRERQRLEKKIVSGSAAPDVTSSHAYDALGRLAGTSSSNGLLRSFQYDPLGNLLKHDDGDDANDVTITYRTDNRDQICFVGYGTAQPAAQHFGNPTHISLVPGVALESPLTLGDVSGNMPAGVTVDVALENLIGADLLIELVAPDGTAYALASVAGVAPTYEADLAAPATVGNETANGTWRLRVSNHGYPGGYLANWGMTLPVCNVVHDADGNIVVQPTPAGSRTLSYSATGQVKAIADASAQAAFRYDAFGNLQELDVQGATSDPRRDRYYGLVQRRDVAVGNATTPILARNFPLGGMMASRRDGADWVFSIGEARGNRVFVDGQGEFLQDVDYDAFGKPTSIGPAPTDRRNSRDQWNGGDFLGAFSLSQLGARIYDPILGRFLSPDPLVLMRTGATSNPFAFADNDPVNRSDPSGLCTGSETVCPEGTIAPGTVGNPNNPTRRAGGQHTKKPPAPPKPVTPASPPDVDVAARRRQENWDRAMREQQAYDAAMRAVKEARYQAERLRHPEREAGSPSVGAAVGIFMPPIFVPKYYVKDYVSRARMQNAQTGIEYFAARDEYNAANVTRVLKIVNEEAGNWLSMAMMLQGSLMGSTSPRVKLGRVQLPARKCFVAGTLVSTADGHVPIEAVKLGDRVEAGNPQCAREHLPEEAVTLVLDVPNPERPAEMDQVALVRSRGWVAENGLDDGEGFIDMAEIGVSGWATVSEIGPPPLEQSGDGCLVLMTVSHVAQDVLALELENGTRLELTSTHPLYVEGQGWTAARDLAKGQLLRTDKGPLALGSVGPGNANQRVYNLEVGLEHAYRVSRDDIWAHNNCALVDRLVELGTHRDAFKDLIMANENNRPPSGLPRILQRIDQEGIIQTSRNTGGYRRLSPDELEGLNNLRRTIANSERAAGNPVPAWLEPPPR